MKSGTDALRVVLDTNVLFSALAFPKGTPPDLVYAKVLDGDCRLCISEAILAELAATLLTKGGWDLDRVQRQVGILRAKALLVFPRVTVRIIRRKDSDNRILECALAAEAAALISGDRRDLLPLREFRGIPILTPRDFLDRYFYDSETPPPPILVREPGGRYRAGRRKMKRI